MFARSPSLNFKIIPNNSRYTSNSEYVNGIFFMFWQISFCLRIILLYSLFVSAKKPSCRTVLPFINSLHLYLNHRGIPVTISNKIQPNDQTSTFDNVESSLSLSRADNSSGGMYSGVIVWNDERITILGSPFYL